MPKFSIIIPVYKVEKYIERCISSILSQTYNDWECILVDDGSPDKSGQICDRYAKKDSRIQVIHKQNGGVSSARNRGIEDASGEYVFFVDADDVVEYNALEIISSVIKLAPDVVLFDANAVSTNGKSTKVSTCVPAHIKLDKNGIKEKILPLLCNTGCLNAPWNKVYKRSIIVDNNLIFLKRVRGEDMLFNIDYFQHINTAYAIDIPIYNYMQNNESAMGRYVPEEFEIWLENGDAKEGLIKKYNIDIDLPSFYANRAVAVFWYILDFISHHEGQAKIIGTISNKEFQRYCLLSNRWTPFFTNPFRVLVSYKLSWLACLYIKLIYLLLKITGKS